MSLLSERDRTTLVRVLRVMYPHESFPDGPYERTADAVVDTARADPRMLAQLVQGLHDLDAARGRPFVELPDDVALSLLRGVQDVPAFGCVRGVAVARLYDDHEVWDLLGYEGPSFERGGYLHRGFDDLDWLPEPRITEVDDEGVA